MPDPYEVGQGFLPMNSGVSKTATNPMTNWKMPDYGKQPVSYAEMTKQKLASQTQAPWAPGTNANTPNSLGQTTKMGWGGAGGYFDLGTQAVGVIGNLAMANKQNQLAASDLDFRRNSFEKQYQSQRSLVNDELFDRQQRREREGGMNEEQARVAADQYVKNRGVA